MALHSLFTGAIKPDTYELQIINSNIVRDATKYPTGHLTSIKAPGQDGSDNAVTPIIPYNAGIGGYSYGAPTKLWYACWRMFDADRPAQNQTWIFKSNIVHPTYARLEYLWRASGNYLELYGWLIGFASATLLVSTASNPFPAANTWFLWVWEYDSVANTVTLYVNGTSVLQWAPASLGITRIDFLSGGIRVPKGGGAPSVNSWECAGQVNDTSGSIDNVAPSFTALNPIFPATPTGNGDHTAWTGDYTDVDENPTAPDGDTTYIRSVTNGDKESVHVQDAAAAGFQTVEQVGVAVQWRSEALFPPNSLLMKEGANEVSLASIVDGAAYSGRQLCRGKAPDGSAWTDALFNNTQVGVQQSGTNATRATNMVALVRAVVAAAVGQPTMRRWGGVAHMGGSLTGRRSW